MTVNETIEILLSLQTRYGEKPIYLCLVTEEGGKEVDLVGELRVIGELEDAKTNEIEIWLEGRMTSREEY